MKRNLNVVTLFAVMIAFFVGSAGIVDAQKRNDKDIRDTLRALDAKLDDFEFNLDRTLRSNSAEHDTLGDVAGDISSLKDAVGEFHKDYDLKHDSRDGVNRILEPARRVDEFLQKNPQNRRIGDDWVAVKKQIDRLGANYGIVYSWDAGGNTPMVRDDPGTTAKNTDRSNSVTVGLSGTYDLDVAKSERADDAIGNIDLKPEQRDDLKEKLEAPGQIAIEVRGDQVTIATAKASPVSFTADGREKTEQSDNGKTVRVRAALNGQTLVLSSLGGDTDYTITFASSANGQSLKVTRRITTDYLNQTVFAESFYNKTDQIARLGIDQMVNVTADTTNSGGNTTRIDPNPSTDRGGNTTSQNRGGNTTSDQNGGYSDNDQPTTIAGNGQSDPNGNNYPDNQPINQPNGRGNGYPNGSGNPNGRGNGNSNGRGSGSQNGRGNGQYGGAPRPATTRNGDFVVPNGVIITGTLDNEINTKATQNNDRFRLTVQTPDDFRGAVIEGYVSGVSRAGRVTGRSQLTFNFEKITLRDGKTYDFAAYLQSIRDQYGKAYPVDAEGTVRGSNQGAQTAKRSGVGAGIGAVIGVIAGGGTGAAIGAAIGAGAGAGSVIVQGREDIQLRRGSTLTVQSSSPIRQTANKPTDK